MLELLALLLGLASWCLPILCLLRRKHISRPKISALQSGNLALCAIALYIPSLSQYLGVLEKDYSAMITAPRRSIWPPPCCWPLPSR